MSLLHHVQLQSFTTFGVPAICDHYLKIESEEALTDMLDSLPKPISVLGGGSNVLLTGNMQGTLIHNAILGKTIVDEEGDEVTVRIGAGEEWHALVLWTLEEGLYGLENLSLIPGKVGAAPIQNIGAYGVEQEEYFVGLECIHLTNGRHFVFSHEECEFGYRDSFFKNEGKGQYCITAVYYKLSKRPNLRLKYGAISNALVARSIDQPTPKDVSDVVIEIRQSKLPDPAIIGNGGSFFKNPILPTADVDRLKAQWGDMPIYPVDEDTQKLSAGWLIDQCGWKGRRVGETGTYANHALVLVNHGDATGAEIWAVAEHIIGDVQDKFGVTLEPEVNRW